MARYISNIAMELEFMAKTFEVFAKSTTVQNIVKKATPFQSDNFENLHDKELRSAIEKSRNKEVIVYHGTSVGNLVKILSHGSLDPGKSSENKNYDNSSAGIFVSKNISGLISAEMYSHKSSSIEGSNPVILELVIPLSWIEEDPDDTRINESGEMNDLGRNQGIVRRQIPASRIKRIQFIGPEISQVSNFGSPNMFNDLKTEWITIGKFIDILKKNKKVKLPIEYDKLIESAPKGLSKTEPRIENEQIIAQGLQNLHDNFFEPEGQKGYQRALIQLLNDPDRKAISVIRKYIGEENWLEFTGSNPFEIKPFDNIVSYLKRNRYM